MVLIPVADNAVNFPLFMGALLVALVAMSTYRSPAVALHARCHPQAPPLPGEWNYQPHGSPGRDFSLVLISALVPKEGKPNYLPIFACVGALMVVAVVILFLTVKEKKSPDEMRAG